MTQQEQTAEGRVTAAGLQYGFMKILKDMTHLFPRTKETIKINAVFTDKSEETQVTLQGKYDRVFRLTSWYRRNNAQPGDKIEVSKKEDKYFFTLKKAGAKMDVSPTPPAQVTKQLKKPVGEPINFRGLVYAPVNENGVIFLFGLVAKDLGIMVEGVQSFFPDAFGRRLVGDRYYPVDIEFKFKSSGYRDTYLKEKLMCDILVCWEHDWNDHPAEIEVIELKSKIHQLVG